MPDQPPQPRVTILAEREIPSDREEGAQIRTLGAALTHSFTSDAHFQQGHAAHSRRFKRNSTSPVTMTCIAFDFDAPGHTFTEEWGDGVSYKIERVLLAAHPGGFVYRTRNGFRVLYGIEPTVIADGLAAQRWQQTYVSLAAYLERRFGLKADRSCADHTRLFRLPRVTRPPATLPEIITSPLDDCCDPRDIARLRAEPDDGDRMSAAAAFPRLFEISSTAPLCGAGTQSPTLPRRLEGSVIASRGLIYELLSRRGDIRSPHDLGDGSEAFIVRCPRAAHHSRGTGDDALLIAAHSGGPGWLTCRHNGCAGLEPADWLAALGVVQRVGTVTRWFVNEAAGRGIRLGLDLAPLDGGAPIPYVRVSSGTPAWSALWRAADVEAPSDLDHAADLGEALRELKGRQLTIQLAEGKTRRILPAPALGAVAA